MYQIIGEEITVAGVYQRGKFQPKKFLWRHKTFVVDHTHSVHDFRDGAVRKRRFSLESNHHLYLIEFNRDNETWFLEQIWMEA